MGHRFSTLPALSALLLLGLAPAASADFQHMAENLTQQAQDAAADPGATAEEAAQDAQDRSSNPPQSPGLPTPVQNAMALVEEKWTVIVYTVPEISLDPVQYAFFCATDTMICPTFVKVRACTGVLLVGAETELLPNGGLYAEVAKEPGGTGAYGGASSQCEHGILYVGRDET